MLKPLGSPVAVQTTVGAPPVSVYGLVVYADPTVAVDSVAGPVTTGAAYTVMEYCWVAVFPLASIACTVKVLAPGAPVGVPVMVVVAPEAPSVSPVGRAPAVIDHAVVPVPPALVMVTPVPFA
jgi:hypothetical protein